MDYKVTDAELTAVADALRQQSGSNEQIEWPNGYVTVIQQNTYESGDTIRF